MKFKRLLVALGAGIALAAPAADELTRVIGYNVLIGFNRAERIEETANWLRSRKPDVILFQEIARQSSESFARQAKLWDHSYAAVCKPWQDYSIGMTSKRPFEMLEMRIDGCTTAISSPESTASTICRSTSPPSGTRCGSGRPKSTRNG